MGGGGEERQQVDLQGNPAASSSCCDLLLRRPSKGGTGCADRWCVADPISGDAWRVSPEGLSVPASPFSVFCPSSACWDPLQTLRSQVTRFWHQTVPSLGARRPSPCQPGTLPGAASGPRLWAAWCPGHLDCSLEE